MNKLILEVQEQIKKERADAKTEQEKKYVRTMLGVIEGKKDRIERLQRDIKKVEKMMEDKDYSSMKPVTTRNINVMGQSFTYTSTGDRLVMGL